MTSYRPVCDTWILARPKIKYWGAYPNGFLERARWLLGNRRDSVLHVCGGMAKDYPAWKKLCPNDLTLDLDPACAPDFLADALDPLPPPRLEDGWAAILCDPPYTAEDAKHYVPQTCPSARAILKNALASVVVGGRVGMLHLKPPRPPSDDVRFLANISVVMGFDNQQRCFSIYERTA